MGHKPRRLADRLAAVIPKLFAADLAFGESLGLGPGPTVEEALPPPASPGAIDELESFLGVALPPSYRAFLSLHDGWLGVPGCGGADLLGTAAHRSEHVRNVLRWKSDFFDEFENTNPIAAGAIPLAIGDDRNMWLLEPPARADGEMTIATYYLTEREQEYPDLLGLFEALRVRLERDR